jgi:hypothetical protein
MTVFVTEKISAHPFPSLLLSAGALIPLTSLARAAQLSANGDASGLGGAGASSALLRKSSLSKQLVLPQRNAKDAVRAAASRMNAAAAGALLCYAVLGIAIRPACPGCIAICRHKQCHTAAFCLCLVLMSKSSLSKTLALQLRNQVNCVCCGVVMIAMRCVCPCAKLVLRMFAVRGMIVAHLRTVIQLDDKPSVVTAYLLSGASSPSKQQPWTHDCGLPVDPMSACLSACRRQRRRVAAHARGRCDGGAERLRACVGHAAAVFGLVHAQQQRRGS